MTPGASSRWCPTPEQLMILEEMYKGGIRTPNASQIQQITAHLSYYGKIEGKNVFYWFQNHKARDRQKLRRKLFTKQIQQHQYQQQQQQLMQYNHQLHHHQHFLPQLSHYTPLGFLPQLGGVEEAAAAAQMMSYSWKVDHDGTPLPLPPGRAEIDKYMNRTCGCDWMMMMDVGPVPPPQTTATATASSCISRPLKTLELFPITSTGLKEEINPSNLQTPSSFPTKP